MSLNFSLLRDPIIRGDGVFFYHTGELFNTICIFCSGNSFPTKQGKDPPFEPGGGNGAPVDVGGTLVLPLEWRRAKLVSDVLHQVRSIVEASFLLFPLVTYGVCRVGGHSAGSHPTSRNLCSFSHAHTQGQQNLEGRAFLLLKLVSALSTVALGNSGKDDSSQASK